MKITIRTESTQFGAHTWINWLRCPRLAWLKERQRLERETDPLERRRGLLSGIPAFDIGSIVHGILAAHYTVNKVLDTRRFEYRLDTGDPLDLDAHFADVEEADRLYRAYRAFWPKNDLGIVLAVEQELSAEFDEQTVTGGLDLVVEMRERDVTRLAPFIPGLEEPGVYIVDHKARGARLDPMQFEVDLHDPQFTLYPVLWELNHTLAEKVRGSIVNVLHKDKGQPTFKRHLIPRMAIDAEWPIVKGTLALGYKNRVEALRLIDSGGMPEANTSQCFKYGMRGWEACAFYKSGACDRKQHRGRK